MKHITIDCALIEEKAQFHQALAQALDFPAHYGNNLDALYDCLSDIHQDTHLTLTNWEHMAAFSRGFRFVLDDAENENPHLTVTIV